MNLLYKEIQAYDHRLIDVEIKGLIYHNDNNQEYYVVENRVSNMINSTNPKDILCESMSEAISLLSKGLTNHSILMHYTIRSVKRHNNITVPRLLSKGQNDNDGLVIIKNTMPVFPYNENMSKPELSKLLDDVGTLALPWNYNLQMKVSDKLTLASMGIFYNSTSGEFYKSPKSCKAYITRRKNKLKRKQKEEETKEREQMVLGGHRNNLNIVDNRARVILENYTLLNNIKGDLFMPMYFNYRSTRYLIALYRRNNLFYPLIQDKRFMRSLRALIKKIQLPIRSEKSTNRRYLGELWSYYFIHYLNNEYNKQNKEGKTNGKKRIRKV